jgi:hypothetical protein
MNISGVGHLHSQYSYDGKLSLTELREIFIAKGVRFALMTEHTDELTADAARSFIDDCRTASDDSFIFIPGFEVPYLGTHILVIGARQYYENAQTAELLAKWKADGALLIMAHPHRNGYKTDAFLKENLDGVEIWNSQYDGIHAPRAQAWHLREQLGIMAYGSIDLHRRAHANGPQLIMNVAALNQDEIMAKLRAGEFFIIRNGVSIDSNGRLTSGNIIFIRALSWLMPIFVGFLRRASSLAAAIGLKSLPGKRWLRERV